MRDRPTRRGTRPRAHGTPAPGTPARTAPRTRRTARCRTARPSTTSPHSLVVLPVVGRGGVGGRGVRVGLQRAARLPGGGDERPYLARVLPAWRRPAPRDGIDAPRAHA